MKCPECGFEIGSLPCWQCEREALDREWEYKSLMKEFSLIRGEPNSNSSRKSLEHAVDSMRKRLAADEDVTYDPQFLLRSRTWWYIPYSWIGCAGFIVNMGDSYVNWLGSALKLRECFWGHERGIICDLVDFEFAPDTDLELVARLLKRFKHMFPNERGVLPNEPVWYRDSEIPAAIEKQFPVFRRHFTWFAIPELMNACEKEGMRFTCRLAAPTQTGLSTN
jgi:hypothetical protein